MASNGENFDNAAVPAPEIASERSPEEYTKPEDPAPREDSRERERVRERSPERSRSRRSRSRDRRDRYRSRSRDRSDDRSRDRRRERSTDRYRDYRDSRNGRHSRRRHSRSRSPPRRKQRSRSPPRRKGTPPPSKVLGVFGLSLRTRERDLEELFDEFGKHERVTIVYDHRTDRSRGFGFVYFEHEDDAARAKEKTNGLELHGRRIRVDFSMTARPHSPTPGQYMGRKTERSSRRHSRSRSWSRSRSRGRSYSR